MPRLQAVYFWVTVKTVKCDKLTKREERKAKPGYLVKMAEINSQQEKQICPNCKNSFPQIFRDTR